MKFHYINLMNLKLLFKEYGENFAGLRQMIRDLERLAAEAGLDFGEALNDYGCVDGECGHSTAFPCEDGSVYCPECQKVIVSPLQSKNL